ncbi:MAG TPA: hypothetical protein VKP65_20560, partial [Rhodothermales bacterium]|nr:hypothetical protein [Rhodothermales bacterium]
MADSLHNLPRLPCCIEAPADYLPKAQYALQMLLLPLGLEPAWVEKEALGKQGLYYGPDATQDAEVLTILLNPRTVSFFASEARYQPEQMHWIEWKGERWPVLFGEADTPRGDLVASVFFWLSGWQEQTTTTRDRHGRFPHAASLQAQWGTTTRPAVDAYREWLAE